MKAFVLEAYHREEIKTSRAKKLRRQNMIPAVMYGPDTQPRPLKVPLTRLESVLSHATETTPIVLNILLDDGKTESKKVFIKSIQRHKVTDRIIHVDFYAPSESHKMHINIPLKFVGRAKGEEKGGIVEVFHHEVPCEFLPKDIVDYIEVDVSNVDLNESLHVKDVVFPEGIKPLLHPEDVILTIVAPRGLEVEEAELEAAEAEEAEPEVLRKGKAEEEEEEE
ncbi:MAG: large subunit ribosomal protein [Thermotogota bacterium]|nr:large subunit ribosomal protein [Thermotogota bacterium]MDK2863991.1 large subunit ribosomal protein [Thermotogota bacterium]HCZ06546.1 50S ribosomal protein L25 [Thermotogota bacterium]